MNRFLTLARLGDVIRRLHPHQRIHPYAERFFEAQSHIGGERCVAVKEIRERWPGDNCRISK